MRFNSKAVRWSAILRLWWRAHEMDSQPKVWLLFSCRRGESNISTPQCASTGKHALAWLQQRETLR
jgi:hypothetical protein